MAGLNNLKKTTPANPRISLAGDSASSPGKENGDEEKQEEEVLVVNDGTGEVDEDDIRYLLVLLVRVFKKTLGTG